MIFGNSIEKRLNHRVSLICSPVALSAESAGGGLTIEHRGIV